MFACIEQIDRIDGCSIRVVEFDSEYYYSACSLVERKAPPSAINRFDEQLDESNLPYAITQILIGIARGDVVVEGRSAWLVGEEFTIGISNTTAKSKVAYVDCLLANEG